MSLSSHSHLALLSARFSPQRKPDTLVTISPGESLSPARRPRERVRDRLDRATSIPPDILSREFLQCLKGERGGRGEKGESEEQGVMRDKGQGRELRGKESERCSIIWCGWRGI